MNALVAHKRILTILNILVVSSLIFLYHMGLFGDISLAIFTGVSIGLFVLALYNPLVVFVLFVGVIPLEIVDIAPDTVEIMLRPYQILGIIVFCAVILRKIFGVSGQRFLVLNISDKSMFTLVLLSFVGLFWVVDVDVALKQTIIFTSFVVLYFVTRLFVRSKEDVLSLFPIIISSATVVGLYAIIQNILYKNGLAHMEVMPGRPNATFAEADWLGMYLVFIIAVILAYLYYNAYYKHLWKFFDGALIGVTVISFVALVLTVARSAWLGAAVVIVVYMLILFLQKKYKLFARHSLWIASMGVSSILIVWMFGLTSFELGNRLQSTNNGLQEITISCQCSGQTCLSTTLVIDNVDELEQYNCRHINLEEIDGEVALGNIVTKIHRTDPNIAVRAQVYKKTISYIKQKPFIGYGWGSSAGLLGKDESGTSLNTSNIFLEVTLSVGLIGLGILIVIFGSIIISSIKVLHTSNNMMAKSVAVLGTLGVIAIIVPNLFNAGLFLGFVWVFLGMINIVRKI